MDRRIFCIGAHKTGSTSLENALSKLGYLNFARNEHYRYPCPGHAWDIKNQIESICKKLLTDPDCQKYKVFSDSPFNLFNAFVQLNAHFPKSNFILTTRNSDEWFESVYRWSHKRNHPSIYKAIYTKPIAHVNKEAIVQVYEQRNQRIRDFFQGTGRFLEIDVCAGEGWETLCHFLGRKVVQEPFPHENKNPWHFDADKNKWYLNEGNSYGN